MIYIWLLSVNLIPLPRSTAPSPDVVVEAPKGGEFESDLSEEDDDEDIVFLPPEDDES